MQTRNTGTPFTARLQIYIEKLLLFYSNSKGGMVRNAENTPQAFGQSARLKLPL